MLLQRHILNFGVLLASGVGVRADTLLYGSMEGEGGRLAGLFPGVGDEHRRRQGFQSGEARQGVRARQVRRLRAPGAEQPADGRALV